MRTLPFLLLAACSVSDPSILDPLRGDGGVTPGEDGEVPMEDMATPDDTVGANLCNDLDDPLSAPIAAPREQIVIDTRTATDSVQLECGSVTTPGPDRFLALEVGSPQEIWHFHLIVKEADGPVNPVLYLLQGGSQDRCDARNCFQVSDSCVESGEEHFAFIAPTGGTWFVGVDSGAADTGALFELNAYRPVCGDGVRDHAESCDGEDDALCGGAPCVDCHCVVNDAFPSEKAFNDTIHEANLLEIDDGDLTLTGAIGGTGRCNFPDYYLLEIEDQQDLEMRLRTGTGLPCDADHPVGLQLQLQSKDGITDLRAPQADANGCAFILEEDMTAGIYLLKITHADPADRSSIGYQVAIDITP
ncbi:MAG: hypothetical protein CMN30_30195 [Sandaracinus sp.]|nr:hypothetical protein [Sandaracinus sp.]